MSNGVIVALGVVGVLALCETVLPWVFAALRRWRQERASRTVAASATGAVTYASSGTDLPAPGRGGRDGTVTADPLASAGRGGRDGTEARRLWEEARTMTHNFTPDWEEDQDYLAKVYGAARLGHLEAMVKLGEYAGRRDAVVEAFYWTLLAELKGATGLGVALREMRSRWLSKGCPAEYRNAYGEFTEEQGVFARAVLRLQCGVDPQYALARLKELAERGVEEAQLFLRKV